MKRLKRRMKRIFWIRYRPSLYDRKFHSKILEDMLTKSFMQKLEKAYLFTSTEGSEENLKDVLRFVENGHYLRLSRMRNRCIWYEDEFGSVPSTKSIDI